MIDWGIYRGDTTQPHDGIKDLPEPPSWRAFESDVLVERQLEETDPRSERRLGGVLRGETFQTSTKEVESVNAALYLRRPLLITGKPGTGKSSLIYAVARELRLGPVLRWPITSRSTLQEGLYRYDAIGRLQAANFWQATVGAADPTLAPPTLDIGDYIRLGPLGTALLPSRRPRALLIDEIDKSDIDLPNDLLNIFEEGEFTIPELERLPEGHDRIEVRPVDGSDKVPIIRGQVRCHAFPFVVLTSNAEREFPPPFLRRCLRLDIDPPDKDKLATIIEAHLGPEARQRTGPLVETFLARRNQGDVATDQLLNAVFLVMQGVDPSAADKQRLLDVLFRHLSGTDMR
jgi:MoxR-like ATPase